MDTATSLFFSMQDGGAPPEPGAADAIGFDPPPWYTLVWPAVEAVPEAWLEQGLCFTEGTQQLVQPKNGPCGVLAAVHGVVVARALAAGEVVDPSTPVTDAALAGALAAILQQCAGVGRPVQLPAWGSDVGKAVRVEEVGSAEAGSAVLAAIDAFKGRGGCVLLVYAALLTRGVDQVKTDVMVDMGEPPLVVGPHRICSSELMALLLKGVASGNFGAQNATNTAGNDWPPALGVGMLSSSELEGSMTICNALKSPAQPVWVLHGGDHFTLAWAAAAGGAGDGESPPTVPSTTPSEFILYHWNGLPPHGPRMATITVTAPLGAAPPVEDGPRESTFQPPIPGEIEGIVQAVEEDKRDRPDFYESWRYECVLAVPDPDGKIYGTGGEPHTDEQLAAAKTFALGEPPADRPWRCATCYRSRFKTMSFGMNEAGATHCQHEPCGGAAQSECGWSIILPYDELPPEHQETLLRRHAAKIVPLLR
jgi:hypothetical protein